MLVFYSLLVLLFVSTTSASNVNERQPCAARRFALSVDIVCVCNSTYCDDIEPVGLLDNDQAVIYTSTRSGARLDRQTVQFEHTTKQSTADTVRLLVNSSKTYQQIFGFGGAFTDSVGINLNALSESTRDRLMRQYFGDEGIGYTLGRVPIASTDFSTHEYSYLMQPDDFELKNFALADEDHKLKIPYLHEARKLAGDQLKLFASPWSAPAWMKTNEHMKGGGTLKGTIDGDYYKTYSKYLVRFFEEYAAENVSFWALTTQNEPSTGLVPFYPWQTMWLSSFEQSELIKRHLGPAMRASAAASHLKLIINDDNIFMLPWYINKILTDPKAAAYVDGVGLHWYENDLFGYSRLDDLHKAHPEKFALATEACTGWEVFDKGVSIGNWQRGARYTRDIMSDLHRWTVGWTDWNLVLDTKGGPTWVGNYVDAPILVNTTADEFFKQPMFYALAHFSRFVPPGSKRINSVLVDSSSDRQLDAIAFHTPSNQIVVVAHNQHLDHAVTLRVESAGREETLIYQLPAASIATFVWNES